MSELNEPVDPRRAGVAMRLGIKIPMRDGVRLDAQLYLPKGPVEPSPVIFTLTPYIAQSYHPHGLYYAAHGYPFLAVDVRGRGNSEGEFAPYMSDADDGYDLVEWLAQQPYCNGRVAMWGGSYSGHNQFMTASRLPPHLATITPLASPYIGVDYPIRNNVFAPYVMSWLTYVAGHTSQEKMFWGNDAFWSDQYRQLFESGAAFRQLDTLVGHPSKLFQEWQDHPEQDAYWDERNPTAEQYAQLAIPILSITGSYDDDQPGALRHYREHMKHASAAARSRHFLIIGPWDHAGTRYHKEEFIGIKVGPASVIDSAKLHREWYAWTMQGGPKPEFLENNVAYYVMGAEKWRYSDTLDAITARTRSLLLQSTGNPTDVFASGRLAEDGTHVGGPDSYVYDPRDVSHAALESSVNPESKVDQRMMHALAGKQLYYHSAPFETDVEVSGFFSLSLWLAIDQPDTDFHVSVHEISVDGTSIQLSADWLRARYRQSFRRQALIGTTEPLRYDFKHFTFVSRQVKKGNRLRLVIGPLSSIYFQRNYNSGAVVVDESIRDARPVTVTLFHDPGHPSALRVPIGQPE